MQIFVPVMRGTADAVKEPKQTAAKQDVLRTV